MCQNSQSPPAKYGSEEEPSPPPLQFVPVGPGGTVSSLSAVRSHVMKGQHLKRRETKKAALKKGTQQKLMQLRPSQATQDSSIAATASTESFRSASPLTGIQYEANLVPYAWFERDGPVLYVNRSRWPFPSNFQVTASDRRDNSKSVVPRQSHWMPYTRSPDYVMVKGAVLDAPVLSWIGQSPECFQFRVDTIKWIQDQLKDPANAVSNATIGAIMTFTQWTAGYRNPDEISSHMDAVERIVELRGGFHSFQSDGPMIAKLTLFDSMVAVLTGKPPRFPLVNYFVTRPITTRTIYRESPLSDSGNFEGIITYPQNQNQIIACIKKMWILTQDFESRHQTTTNFASRSQHPAIPFQEEARHSYKTPLLTLPLLSSCYDPSHNHVLETLQKAASIYTLTLTWPHIDFPSPQNEDAFKKLCAAFGKSSHDEFWERYPGVLLWVLLVGTAAARGKEVAAFWMFYMGRVGSFSNAEGWLMGSSAINRFLRIQGLKRDGASGEVLVGGTRARGGDGWTLDVKERR